MQPAATGEEWRFIVSYQVKLSSCYKRGGHLIATCSRCTWPASSLEEECVGKAQAPEKARLAATECSRTTVVAASAFALLAFGCAKTMCFLVHCSTGQAGQTCVRASKPGSNQASEQVRLASELSFRHVSSCAGSHLAASAHTGRKFAACCMLAWGTTPASPWLSSPFALRSLKTLKVTGKAPIGPPHSCLRHRSAVMRLPHFVP